MEKNKFPVIRVPYIKDVVDFHIPFPSDGPVRPIPHLQPRGTRPHPKKPRTVSTFCDYQLSLVPPAGRSVHPPGAEHKDEVPKVNQKPLALRLRNTPFGATFKGSAGYNRKFFPRKPFGLFFFCFLGPNLCFVVVVVLINAATVVYGRKTTTMTQPSPSSESFLCDPPCMTSINERCWSRKGRGLSPLPHRPPLSHMVLGKALLPTLPLVSASWGH